MSHGKILPYFKSIICWKVFNDTLTMAYSAWNYLIATEFSRKIDRFM